jgi:hypothetical protein
MPDKLTAPEERAARDEARREASKVRSRAYYQANKEKLLAKMKARNEAAKRDGKPTYYQTKGKAYYEANREEITAKQKAYREANREPIKAYEENRREAIKTKDKRKQYRREYGITPEQIEAMMTRQDSRCAICRTAFTLVPIHVDHCHSTGRIRGLLCRDCNWGLGYFRDDAALLWNAIKYLA